MNIDITFWTGIIGSLILVTGAAWGAEKVKKPIQSIKNWLFAIGGLIMLIYSGLNFYFNQAPFFFVIFELFIGITSILMMLDTDDRLDTIIVTIGTVVFVIWSMMLFKDYSTIIFILGLCITGLGYTLQMNTVRRNLALTIGSATIAIFSFLAASWIFFWLNAFFALFSGYYLIKSKYSKTKKLSKFRA